jgi:uncharacterized iron-regulated membrane protein
MIGFGGTIVQRLHRYVAVVAAFLALYVGATGTLIQLTDLWTLLSHAPASDPNLQSMRQGRNGPQNFQVVVDADYDAGALPAEFDFDRALTAVVTSARTVAAGAPLRFVELRLAGAPIGQVAAAGKLLRFDVATGAELAGPDTAAELALPPVGDGPSFRITVKNIHRMVAYGFYSPFFFVAVGLTLCVAVVSGLALYFRLMTARAHIGRRSPYWSAGGRWRTLHRSVACSAAIFLVVVVSSGTVLAIGTAGIRVFQLKHAGRPGLTADVSSPLSDAELPSMLHMTLAAYRSAAPGEPIKVIRLRYFAGIPQGVVVGGEGEKTRQVAFETATGRVASLSGPTYPATGQPFGWQVSQTVKGIHSGDFLGLPGRFISLLTGLSLLFLAISGAATYIDLWSRRRKLGRRGLFWP